MKYKLFLLVFLAVISIVQPIQVNAQSSLAITQMTDNRSQYPNNQIPRFEKFEITFQVNGSVAKTFQLPFVLPAPAGLHPDDLGITVDAEFLPPGETNWINAYTQPAFFYQDFLKETRNNNTRDWFYPSGNDAWKIRWAPNQTGSWQYRITATDASGSYTSTIQSFTTVDSTNKGFIRVAQNDKRYFEFADGTYFPSLGYNMNFNHVNWVSPIIQNQNNFQVMGQNGIQLIRIWLSQWSIFGAGWNPWKSFSAQGGDPPLTLLSSNVNQYLNSDHELALKLGTTHPCVFHDPYNNAPVAVKKNTAYQIRVLYYPDNLVGTGGFAVKLGNYTGCATAAPITDYVREGNTGGWQWLAGTFTTATAQDFIDHLFLHLENMTSGSVRVAEVEIKEMVNGVPTGSNILQKPLMDYHRYFDQRNSFAFDQVVQLAKENNVYLRPVTSDHREWTFTHIDHNGNPTDDFSPSGFYFYGPADASINKTRWLQKAWWRYLQARWGYATNIHSWEYVNEGDPGYTGHRISANMMGEYFHGHTPHQLASTSIWSGTTSNWNLVNYPGIDFADVHRYIGRDESPDQYNDAAYATITTSQNRGAAETGGNWPVVRGETGFITTQTDTNSMSFELQQDTAGVWLRTFLWAGLNPNALIESYWYENAHIYCLFNNVLVCPSGTYDHRPLFKAFSSFLVNIPLTNGHYEDAQATSANTNIRIVGQKDLLNKRAHVWIQNKLFTWKNVVNGDVVITPVSASITIAGFAPNTNYPVEWWNTAVGTPTTLNSITSDSSGNLVLAVDNLIEDTAVKIGDYSPSPTRCEPLGDTDCNGRVNMLDGAYIIFKWNTSDFQADFDDSSLVDWADLKLLLNNYGL